MGATFSSLESRKLIGLDSVFFPTLELECCNVGFFPPDSIERGTLFLF